MLRLETFNRSQELGLFNYHGRALDSAVLLRLALQGPEIGVTVGQMTEVNVLVSDTLIVVANGRTLSDGTPCYDVLAGGQVLEKQNSNRCFKTRLVSKQLLKRIEDLSVNGTATIPLEPPRFEQRPYEPREPREHFNRRPPTRQEFAQGGYRTNNQQDDHPPPVARVMPQQRLQRSAALLSTTHAPTAMAQAFSHPKDRMAPEPTEAQPERRPILRRTPSVAPLVSTEPDSIGATIAQALRNRS